MNNTRTKTIENQARFMQQVTVTADTLFHGKWKLQVLCVMQSGPVRLGQLARMIPRASKKVLTQSLRELEASGIVLRKDLSDLVLHIEYELRPDLKENVSLLLEHVARWGEGYLNEQTEIEKTGEDQEELDFEAQSAAAGVEPKREEKSARVSRIHRSQ